MEQNRLTKELARMRIPKIPLVAGAIALSLAAAGCGGASTSNTTPTSGVSVQGTSTCKSGATPITFWAWVPGMAGAVKAFNASHPDICVSLQNVGSGNQEYVKVTSTLKAGSGAPDVAELEFDELPSFEITHNVVDLSKYGADSVKNKFVSWAWQEVSQGSAVYAMPDDAGPMGLYYNQNLLAQYHITPPATWADFAADAAALHRANPNAYLTNFAAGDLQWILSLMAQDNAFPFRYTGGSNVTIDFTGPAQTAFANYWQNLLAAHEVNATTDMDATSFADLDKGVDATWLSSAWGPSYFATAARASVGQWRTAALPQWSAGANVAANWGGSTYPVFTQSQHPQQAATFAEWLTSSDAAWTILKTSPSSLFPTYQPLLSDPSFTGITVPLSGTATPNSTFAAAATKVGTVQWPPFMTEALTESDTVFAGVLNGTGTLPAAFRAFQDKLVSYAKAQGFTVSTS
jgi:multiple sugar transport system substrate-binding protein